MTGSANWVQRARVGLPLAFALLSLATSPLTGSRHPAVGSWTSAFLDILVDPDGFVSVNGVGCDWTSLDGRTIEIQPRTTIRLPELADSIDSSFRFEIYPRRRYARVDVLGEPEMPLILLPIEDPPLALE